MSKARNVKMIYSEVMNESEVLMIFETEFNSKQYHTTLIFNINWPEKMADYQIEKSTNELAYMDRNDAAYSEVVE